jgi:hypothetical protein
MQHAEKLDLLVDLRADPAAHVEAVRPLVRHADESRASERAGADEQAAGMFARLRTKRMARGVAEKARAALRIRAKMGHWEKVRGPGRAERARSGEGGAKESRASKKRSRRAERSEV